MGSLYAHSEQDASANAKSVRYLRGDYSEVVRYTKRMQLRIKELRKEREWTVEHLADLVGLSKSYVSEIENGKKQANQARIKKFAEAFGVPVFDLLDQDTLGQDERDLLHSFSSMDGEARRTLLAVALSLKA